MALNVCDELENESIATRVVSLFSWEVFSEQSDEYKNEVLGNSSFKVSIEAQSSFGWERFIGENGILISIDTFGKSGNYSDIKQHFGFTTENIVEKIKKKVKIPISSK